jgi:hypothetical protein
MCLLLLIHSREYCSLNTAKSAEANKKWKLNLTHQWLNTSITDLFTLAYFTALLCSGLSPVCSHACKCFILCAYACLCYTVSRSGSLAYSDSKLIPKLHILDTWQALIGHGVHEHCTKLWTHIHAPDWFQICSLFVHVHALDCSGTIGDIKVYLCHAVTCHTHTPSIKQLKVKMPLSINLMQWKYIDELQA